MAATTTYKQVLERLLSQTDLGYVVPGKVTFTSTTSLTLADNYLEGPFSGSDVPVGTAVKILSPADGGIATAATTTLITDLTKNWVASEWIGFTYRGGGYKGTITANTTNALTITAIDAAPAVGSAYTIDLGDSFVSNYVPATGVLTLNPALASVTLNAAQVRPQTIALLKPEVKRFDYVKDAINRAIDNRATRWLKTPLTFVADGDLRGISVADYWTAAANGVAAYAPAQAYPAGSAADVAGATGLSRVLQLTSSGGGSSVVGNGIRATHTAQLRTWYVRTAIRLVSGTGTATFSIYDNTNSVDIAPTSVVHGSDTYTFATATFGNFMVCEGIIQQPAACDELAPKLTLSATGMVAQMGPVILFPLDAMSFPIPNRIISKDYIGNFHYGTIRSQPGSLDAISYSDPITTGGRTHHIDNNGDHFTVTFNFRPTRPVYFDELTYDEMFNGLADVSSFPLDFLFKWARFELYDYLVGKEEQKFQPYGTRLLPMPLKWLPRRNAALRSVKNSEYEPETMNVYGRV